MLRVLPTVGITVRMVVTATIMIIRPFSLLQHKKKNRQSQKEKKQKESRNFIRTFLMIQSRKVILLKATDFRLSLNLSVKNGNFLLKWQIMSITSFRDLCQKRRYKRIFSNYSLSLRILGMLKKWTIF